MLLPARLLADIGMMALFGALLFDAAIGGRTPRPVRHAALAATLLGIAAWLAAAAMDLGGDVLDVMAATLFGKVLAAQAVLLTIATLLPRRIGATMAGLAVAAGALHGHGMAMGDAPDLVIAQALHLLGAGAWLGGLVPLACALAEGRDAAAARFGRLATIAVILLAASAAWQGWRLGGGLPGLLGTGYGGMLGAKLALMAALLAFASRHRWRLVPALPATRPALIRSIATQAALGLAALAVAAVLADMEPGMHAQPTWPFPWRPDAAALDDPDLRAEIITGTAWCALAILALATALRWRIALLAVPFALWLGLPHLSPLLVEAYPTSYRTEPSDPTPASRARGAVLYAQHCTACHGANGTGDGPQAANLPIPPADLTEPHLWEHLDGELFWWLTAGMRAPDGSLAMPGFAAALSEADRWAVIDYIRARNPHGHLAAGHRHN